MSISSVSNTPPVAPAPLVEARTREPEQQSAAERNPPPPQRPPLPPGQGTRFDQYV
jgi:hypothetical protein